jgi:hypothetical protein
MIIYGVRGALRAVVPVSFFCIKETQSRRRDAMKRPWVGLLAVVLIVGLTAAGCATANKIQAARATMDQARAAGAVYKAPFEYKAAEAYLNKAVLEAEEGDCKAADPFTKEAQAYADKALEMAGGGAK